MKRMVSLVGAAALVASFAGAAGYVVGQSAGLAVSSNQASGYQQLGELSCNLTVERSVGFAVDRGSSPVTEYNRPDLYAADSGCTDGQIVAFNTMARKSGSPDRACRYEFDVRVAALRTDLPQSCARVAKK